MASGIEAGRAFMRLFIDDKAFRRGLDGASKRLKAFGASAANLGASFLAVGAALGAPLAATIKFASDTEETMSKFNVVFGESADEVKKFGDELAATVGRSKTDIAGFLAGFQDLLVPIGIDPKAAEESSKVLTQLAVDLGSFNNKADADVIRDLQAALTGSGEVMKKYGVIVSEAAVKQELLKQGIKGTDASEQQKVFARLNIILAGTTAAQGDAVRTADDYANSMKALQASVKDAASAVGTALLKPLASFARLLKSAVNFVGDFVSANAGIVRVAAIAAAGFTVIGGGLIALGLAATVAGVSLGGLATLVGVIGSAFAAIVSPIGLAVAAVVGIGVAIVKYTSIGAAAVEWLRDQFGNLAGIVQTTFGAVLKALSAGDLEAAAKALMAGLVAAFLEARVKIQALWSPVASFFIDIWAKATSGVVNAMAALQATWAKVVGGMRKAWAIFKEGVQGGWATAQNFVTRGVLQLQKKITEALTGEEFDISVELNQADKKLAATQKRLAAETDQAVADAENTKNETLAGIEATRTAAIEEINKSEADRQGRLNEQLEAAKNAAAEARRNLEQVAKDAEGGGKAAEQGEGDGKSLADKIAEAAGGALQGLQSAGEKIENRGTFSGRAAAAGSLASGGIDAKQLAEQIKANANLAKIVKNTKGAAGLAVGA